tara:strand:+ start:11569 stop:11955 length:387 start_codon:yes stop_codon:yes gene_type:complete
MGKLDDFITRYTDTYDIRLSEDTLPLPGEELAAAPLAPVPPVPPVETEIEKVVKEITPAAYASHVEDMVMMLRIGMKKGVEFSLNDSRLQQLFDEKPITGEHDDEESNVEALHQIVRDIIRDYGHDVD